MARHHANMMDIDERMNRTGSPSGEGRDARTKRRPLSVHKRLRSLSRSPSTSGDYDRFIPSRSGSGFHNSYDLLENGAVPRGSPTPSTSSAGNTDGGNRPDTSNSVDTQQSADESSRATYRLILRNELLKDGIDSATKPTAVAIDDRSDFISDAKRPRTYSFRNQVTGAKSPQRTHSPYARSAVGIDSERLLISPRKLPRKISKVPFKVLDAPELQDDFYLNLVDWSSQDILAVGLGSAVYLWNASTGSVTPLCEVTGTTVDAEGRPTSELATVTSVAWVQRGTHLAVGTSVGEVNIWDVAKVKMVRTLKGHKSRVGALAWNAQILSSGSRDHRIMHRDVRMAEAFVSVLHGHKQEVCGLKWSPDGRQLASGGNDNKLMIWDATRSTPVVKFHEHKAAVKAISWSPHQHGLLASGGGTADRHIRFWNTLTGQPLQSMDTGSQVCSLAWSKTVNELVSTHGYSQNQIVVWKYPSCTQVVTLMGHTYRVLYLAMSPSGETIVTGAGDETLRFWNVFSKSENRREAHSTLKLTLR